MTSADQKRSCTCAHFWMAKTEWNVHAFALGPHPDNHRSGERWIRHQMLWKKKASKLLKDKETPQVWTAYAESRPICFLWRNCLDSMHPSNQHASFESACLLQIDMLSSNRNASFEPTCILGRDPPITNTISPTEIRIDMHLAKILPMTDTISSMGIRIGMHPVKTLTHNRYNQPHVLLAVRVWEDPLPQTSPLAAQHGMTAERSSSSQRPAGTSQNMISPWLLHSALMRLFFSRIHLFCHEVPLSWILLNDKLHTQKYRHATNTHWPWHAHTYTCKRMNTPLPAV